MKSRNVTVTALSLTLAACVTPAWAQQKAPEKPNIILILSDDFGYGDAGVYSGGPGRGMPPGMLPGVANRKLWP